MTPKHHKQTEKKVWKSLTFTPHMTTEAKEEGVKGENHIRKMYVCIPSKILC